MPKLYSKEEREFVLALALATRKPFTKLEPVIRGLASEGMLSWLSPHANDRFADWPAQRGYDWARRYDWNLDGLDTGDATPLPPEEDIDDQILRDRLTVKEVLLENVKTKVGDPHKNSNAFVRVTEQIERQIVRRMSRAITPQTVFELVFRVLERLQGRDPDEQEVYQAIAEEVGRFKYLPAEGAAC